MKNEITISLPDTLFGTYSVGITDADLIRPDIIDLYTKEENILNENPFTLFQLYQSLGKEIDLYLLTLHDNFKQAAAIDSISEIKFNHEAGINIAGKIEYERPGYQISGSVINFFPKNLAYGNFILTDTLDSKGNFRLQNLLVPDSTVLYWKINGFDKKNENKLKLTLNESWFDSLRLRPTLFKEKNLIKKEDAKSTTQTVLNKYYETDSLYNVKSKTLKEVTVFSTKKNRVEELEQKYAGASLFAGKLGFASTYDLEEEKGFYFSVFTYLQTRVPGLKVLGNFDNPLLIYRTPMTLKGDKVTNVAIFLNDTKVEARDVTAIPVSEIGYLKIFRAPFANQLALEDQGPDSQPISLVITIYLRKDARKPETTTDPFFLRSFAVNGYSLPPQFPATEYSKNFESEAIPDKRVTLYWNPELAFINGRAHIVFYNNDFSKKYLIQIEGINELGEAVCFRQIIER